MYRIYLSTRPVRISSSDGMILSRMRSRTLVDLRDHGRWSCDDRRRGRHVGRGDVSRSVVVAVLSCVHCIIAFGGIKLSKLIKFLQKFMILSTQSYEKITVNSFCGLYRSTNSVKILIIFKNFFKDIFKKSENFVIFDKKAKNCRVTEFNPFLY